MKPISPSGLEREGSRHLAGDKRQINRRKTYRVTWEALELTIQRNSELHVDFVLGLMEDTGRCAKSGLETV